MRLHSHDFSFLLLVHLLIYYYYLVSNSHLVFQYYRHFLFVHSYFKIIKSNNEQSVNENKSFSEKLKGKIRNIRVFINNVKENCYSSQLLFCFFLLGFLSIQSDMYKHSFHEWHFATLTRSFFWLFTAFKSKQKTSRINIKLMLICVYWISIIQRAWNTKKDVHI